MILIKNGTVVSDSVLSSDILTDGTKILNIAPDIDAPDAEIIDAKGCYVFPGMIDAHTHMQMENPLAKTADDYESGTAAAICGGTTTIINFATGKPEFTLRQSFENELKNSEGHSSCNYKFHMELVKADDTTLREIHEMEDLGVTSFKIYMAYGFRLNDKQIYKILKEVKKAGLLLESHCENGDLLDCIMEDLVKSGQNLPQNQGKAHPAEAEAEAISRLSYIAKLIDYPVHIVHLSTELGLNEVRKARQAGVTVTAETCPQYITLDDSVYSLSGTQAAKYVFAPPARSKTDKKAIYDAIINGEIQTMATDHCPFNYNTDKIVKNNDLRLIPGGIPGVEHRVSICYTKLLYSKAIDEIAFVKLMAENPAKLYKMYPKKGILKVDSDADIVIYEKTGEHTITSEEQKQNVDYTPYEGMKVQGRVKDVILGGELVVKDGKLIKKHRGQYVK